MLEGIVFDYGLAFPITHAGSGALAVLMSDAKTNERCSTVIRQNVRVPAPIWFRARPYLLVDEPMLRLPLSVNTSPQTMAKARLRAMVKQHGRTGPAASHGRGAEE